jgi:hypothetical protein
MTHANESAFPVIGYGSGLTKREYIAAQIMAAILVNGYNPTGTMMGKAAQDAVEAADNLIHHLNNIPSE